MGSVHAWETDGFRMFAAFLDKALVRVIWHSELSKAVETLLGLPSEVAEQSSSESKPARSSGLDWQRSH